MYSIAIRIWIEILWGHCQNTGMCPCYRIADVTIDMLLESGRLVFEKWLLPVRRVRPNGKEKESGRKEKWRPRKMEATAEVAFAAAPSAKLSLETTTASAKLAGMAVMEGGVL